MHGVHVAQHNEVPNLLLAISARHWVLSLPWLCC